MENPYFSTAVESCGVVVRYGDRHRLVSFSRPGTVFFTGIDGAPSVDYGDPGNRGRAFFVAEAGNIPYPIIHGNYINNYYYMFRYPERCTRNERSGRFLMDRTSKKAIKNSSL